MSSCLVSIVVDSLDPSAAAKFWAELLGWKEVAAESEDDTIAVRAPEPDGCLVRLLFTWVPASKHLKNRIHPDLASDTQASQPSIVDKALSLGAREVDIGQGSVPWRVLADPEGNEFCVLEPRPEYAGCGTVAAFVVDARDPGALASFWSVASGWPVARRHPRIVSLRAPGGRGPWLEFLGGGELRRGGGRLRLEVSGDAGRLRAAGARPAGDDDAGTPGLLLDPEGNEFVLRGS